MSITKENAERIARIAKALSHPTRIMILDFLANQENCYFGDINEIAPVSKATMSQHLSELKNAGLIIGETKAPRTYYCINREAWIEVGFLFRPLFKACQKQQHCY